MDQLPTEIIEYILGVDTLSIRDVFSCGATCKHLYNIINNSSYIWKNVYQRLFAEYEKHIGGDDINWLEETKFVIVTRDKVRKLLISMPERFYPVPDISASDFQDWAELISDRESTYYIVIDYLTEIINDFKAICSFKEIPLITPGNRTLKYYSRKSIQFLRHYKLSQDLKKFMQFDEDERTLEKVATFVAQWCQPIINIEYCDISDQLDDLARQAWIHLIAQNPSHPLFKIPDEKIALWRNRNLKEHQFDAQRCTEILDAVSFVLYKKHNYAENRCDFYNPENSYINVVLERELGLPITLSIIHESVARRLGVNCEPMNIPSHFLLRYHRGGVESSVFYLNASNKGKMFPRGTCPYDKSPQPHNLMPRATAASVMLRMAANLEDAMRESPHSATNLTPLRSVLELSVLVAPKNLNLVLNLARLCMSLNMDTRFIEQIMLGTTYDENQNADHVLQMLRDYESHRKNEHFYEQSIPKTRPKGIRFAVGMLMQHKILNYIGVITDWTPVCKASYAWQKSMNVDCLEKKGKQPFYYVIVEDGTHRYVAEENIEITNNLGELLNNDEIGRHFSHFYVNHFVPNKEKEHEYPEDTIIRCEYYKTEYLQ